MPASKPAYITSCSITKSKKNAGLRIKFKQTNGDTKDLVIYKIDRKVRVHAHHAKLASITEVMMDWETHDKVNLPVVTPDGTFQFDRQMLALEDNKKIYGRSVRLSRRLILEYSKVKDRKEIADFLYDCIAHILDMCGMTEYNYSSVRDIPKYLKSDDYRLIPIFDNKYMNVVYLQLTEDESLEMLKRLSEDDYLESEHAIFLGYNNAYIKEALLKGRLCFSSNWIGGEDYYTSSTMFNKAFKDDEKFIESYYFLDPGAFDRDNNGKSPLFFKILSEQKESRIANLREVLFKDDHTQQMVKDLISNSGIARFLQEYSFILKREEINTLNFAIENMEFLRDYFYGNNRGSHIEQYKTYSIENGVAKFYYLDEEILSVDLNNKTLDSKYLDVNLLSKVFIDNLMYFIKRRFSHEYIGKEYISKFQEASHRIETNERWDLLELVTFKNSYENCYRDEERLVHAFIFHVYPFLEKLHKCNLNNIYKQLYSEVINFDNSGRYREVTSSLAERYLDNLKFNNAPLQKIFGMSMNHLEYINSLIPSNDSNHCYDGINLFYQDNDIFAIPKGLIDRSGWNQHEYNQVVFGTGVNSLSSIFKCLIDISKALNLQLNTVDIVKFKQLLKLAILMKKSSAYTNDYFTDLENNSTFSWKVFNFILKTSKFIKYAPNVITDESQLYWDTTKMMSTLERKYNYSVEVPKIHGNSDIKRFHDFLAAVEIQKKLEKDMAENQKFQKTLDKNKELVAKRKALSYKDKQYSIYAAKTVESILEEGIRLKHCVGGYVQAHCSGTTTILFLRKNDAPDESFYTIELSKTNSVKQIHGYGNCYLGKNPEAIKPVVNWAIKNNIHINKSDLLWDHGEWVKVSDELMEKIKQVSDRD